MRIAHLISGGRLYGAERVVCDLAAGTAQRENRVAVGILASGCTDGAPLPLQQRLEERGVACRVFRQNNRFDGGVLRSLKEWMAGEGFHIVHTHNYKSDILAALLPSNRYFKRRVATVHGYTAMNRKVRCYEALDRFVLKHRFDRVVVVSQTLLAGWHDGRKRFIPNAIDAAFYRPSREIRETCRHSLGVDGAAVVVGFVGRLSPEKRPDRIIRWLAHRHDRSPRVVAVIAGDGVWRERMSFLVHRYDLGGAVRLLGYVADPRALYAAMDVFVLPSEREAWPLVLMEAMAAGAACVGPRAGSVPDILDAGRAGMLFDPHDERSFAEALERIVRDEDRRRIIAAEGQRRVHTVYHTDAMVEAYEHLYKEMDS